MASPEGVLAESETEVARSSWVAEETSRRSSPEANPSPEKTFGFVLILREGERPETCFQIVANYSK